MVYTKKSVALIFGGEGPERHISELSAKNILRTIDRERFSVLPVYISEDGDWLLLDDEASLKSGIPTYPARLGGKSGFLVDEGLLQVDVALPILHGSYGEDGRVQGALDTAHIRYVGCGVGASAACADKVFTKIVARHLGIPTAEWVCACDLTADEARSLAESRLDYPMFVKPADLGSSIGAAVADTPDDFDAAYTEAKHHSDKILIEAKLPVAAEIECAFLEVSGKRHYLASGTAHTGGEFYSFGAKYEGEKALKISHGAPPVGKRADIARYARTLGDAIGLRHIARIDFFLTDNDEVFFNEINTIPGMTDSSLYPSMTEDIGLPHGEFINRLLGEATA